MNKIAKPTILVIFGITGDLAKRKLLLAIERIATTGGLPKHFRIIGVTRQLVSKEEIIQALPDRETGYGNVNRHLEILQLDITREHDYPKLKHHLGLIEQSFGEPAQHLFYLSVPPSVVAQTMALLRTMEQSGQDDTKLLLEKPFGFDLASAKKLMHSITQHFDEERLYLVDHYTANEMAQNLFIFREGNSLFKQTWNKDFIERIEIIASERIGIEGRASFYEQTGALRDFVQNHLLQLAALTIMKLPEGEVWEDICERRLQALQTLTLPAGVPLKNVIRGQYEDYRRDVGNPKSTTETFVSLTLYSSDEQWQGVPITLTTGKKLDNRFSEVRIHYKQRDAKEANQLILRLQPKGGIGLSLWSKRSGYSRELEPVFMQFYHREQARALPETYEQVLMGAFRNDHTLFMKSQEVLASWQILAPIQKAWSITNDDLIAYPPGSTPEAILAMGNMGL